MEIGRAPKQKGKSGYPGQYRNDEGKDPQKYALYEPWEHMSPEKLKNSGQDKRGNTTGTQINGGYPTGGFLKPVQKDTKDPKASKPPKPQAPRLDEYPVNTKPAGHVPFNYHAKSAPAKRVEAPINRGDRKDLAARPFNDPGVVRANVSQDTGHFVGVTYHPRGNTAGFVRAPIGPLDRDTARNMRQHQDMESRPVIRKWDVADRGEVWNPNHKAADWRVMTMPGREQDSAVMNSAIKNYAGGRRPRRWRDGKWEEPLESESAEIVST